MARRQISRGFLPQDLFEGRYRLLDGFALLLLGVHEGIFMLIAFRRKLMALRLKLSTFIGELLYF